MYKCEQLHALVYMDDPRRFHKMSIRVYTSRIIDCLCFCFQRVKYQTCITLTIGLCTAKTLAHFANGNQLLAVFDAQMRAFIGS